MMSWFREFLDIPEERFRGAIWLHEGLSEEISKEYWSRLTGIPKDKFHKTYIAKNKIDSPKIRKNLHQYGIFAIRFSVSDEQRKILGWISAMVGGKMQQVL